MKIIKYIAIFFPLLGIAQQIELDDSSLPELNYTINNTPQMETLDAEECSQVFTDEVLVTGKNSNINYDYVIANDIDVEEGIRFTITQATWDVFVLDGYGKPTFFNVYVYSDNSFTPGTLLAQYNGLPVTCELWSEGGYENLNPDESFNTYHCTVDLSGLDIFVDGTETGKTKYWIGLSSDFTVGPMGYHTAWAAVYDFTYDPVLNSMPNMRSYDGGATFSQDGNHEGFFSVSGLCDAIPENMGTKDLTTIKSSIYPNPVKDKLSIQSEDTIKSVSIYNLSGQKIKTVLASKSINVSDLIEGNYIVNILFENGKTQTHKMLKVK